MSVATTTAIGIAAGVGAASSIGGALIGSSASTHAADTQAQASELAANDQLQLGQENLGLQTAIFNRTQANDLPFLEAGQNAISRINSLNGQQPLSEAPAGSEAPITAPNLSGVQTTIPGAPPIHRATGGPVVPFYMQAATRYKVGEKGPEELDMYPNGTGVVIPHDQLLKRGRYASLIPRAMGGAVGDPGAHLAPSSVSGDAPWTQPGWGAPVADTGSIYGKTTPGGPPIGNGGNPVQPNQPLPAPANGAPNPVNPYGADPNAKADVNNPLVTGGSSTPTQNVPFSAWTQQFQAPTAAQAAATPGFQFAEQQGDQALLDQASAAGTTGSSGTAVALDQYNQNLANTNYQQVYNNAMQQYDQNYNIFSNNQQNQWNRLASTAGIGQTTAGQLSSAGANFGNTAGTGLMTTGSQIGSNLNNIGAALGSGYVGSANAWNGGLSGLSNAAQLPLYMQMLNSGGGGGVNLQGIPANGYTGTDSWGNPIQ